MRKAARARRVKGITGSPGVHALNKQKSWGASDTPSRRQRLAKQVQEHHDAIFDTDATKFDASQRDVGVFEIIDGPYTPPMTLDEYEEELDGGVQGRPGTSCSSIWRWWRPSACSRTS